MEEGVKLVVGSFLNRNGFDKLLERSRHRSHAACYSSVSQRGRESHFMMFAGAGLHSGTGATQGVNRRGSCVGRWTNRGRFDVDVGRDGVESLAHGVLGAPMLEPWDNNWFQSACREKRSRALLRSNSTRDIPVRGASKRPPRLRFLGRGILNISAIPQKTFFQKLTQFRGAAEFPVGIVRRGSRSQRQGVASAMPQPDPQPTHQRHHADFVLLRILVQIR